jgi:hypothetical protein
MYDQNYGLIYQVIFIKAMIFNELDFFCFKIKVAYSFRDIKKFDFDFFFLYAIRFIEK